MPQPYDLGVLRLEEASEVPRLLAQFADLVPQSFADGEYLIREDDTSQDIFIVLRGGLVVEKASAAPGAPPILLACITATPEAIAILGEMAYLGAQRRAASVRSSGRTHTLCLTPGHIDAILEGYPMLTRVICRQFSQRLQDTDQALRALQARFSLNPTKRMAEPGEVLFRAGDPASALYQVVTGSIRLEGPGGSHTLQAGELPQGFLEPGPFLADQPQRHTATVQEPAFLVMITAEYRAALVRCYPELALDVLARFKPTCAD